MTGCSMCRFRAVTISVGSAVLSSTTVTSIRGTCRRGERFGILDRCQRRMTTRPFYEQTQALDRPAEKRGCAWK